MDQDASVIMMCQLSMSLYCWITFHCVDRLHFVCPNDQYVNCFHFLAIMNSTAITIQVHVSVGMCISILLSVYLGVEVLGDIATPSVTF